MREPYPKHYAVSRSLSPQAINEPIAEASPGPKHRFLSREVLYSDLTTERGVRPALKSGSPRPTTLEKEPSVAVTGETTRIVGILGSTRRDGPWQPSSTTQAVAVLGSCKLDLRQATIDSPVEIAATAVFGAVDIIVRPDTEVALSGVAIVGSKDIKGTAPEGRRGRRDPREGLQLVRGRFGDPQSAVIRLNKPAH
jgi:hypothetical protein